MSQNLWFSDVVRRYRDETLGKYGLIPLWYIGKISYMVCKRVLSRLSFDIFERGTLRLPHAMPFLNSFWCFLVPRILRLHVVFRGDSYSHCPKLFTKI